MDGTKEFFEQSYDVRRIPVQDAKSYIIAHHYTHGCHNGPSPCYGLYAGQGLIGVLMFAQPNSENVRASIWGRDYKSAVIELHRLHIMDITPRNTETWFMAKCFALLHKEKPEIKGILSFADTTEGHSGTIYQAMNFYYVGKTNAEWFYRDSVGRLRHRRQNGKNISPDAARERGWIPERRAAKNRYLYFLANDRREKKALMMSCRYDVLHYQWCPVCGKPHLIGCTCRCGQHKEKTEPVLVQKGR